MDNRDTRETAGKAAERPAQLAIHEPFHEQRPYLLVAERVREFARQNGIGPGARLPSERILASKLHVSRASLREALIALELGGLIDVRSCSGVYLRACKVNRLPEAGPGPFELLSARRLVEPELAAMAARVATDGAIDALFAAAAEMERLQGDKAGCERADRAFHQAIAEATGNSALAGVVDYLWNQRGSLWLTLEELFETEELRKETLADHRRIVQAISAHDPAAARQAMRAHLERVSRTLSRG
ncbi:FadR/GntR family transcriptional regulator [Massilia terrae]|uniref:FadR family transcriptional regulator n=1 Tax=Massilia terrae TaxID=1811224 RepID=A0ABT2CUX7_9BURK|nr:FadR/GntR family transcriptional regulator [Massilia terrae]MCS0657780.1 FadR family transcriptional regulator [Massilia terrae]